MAGLEWFAARTGQIIAWPDPSPVPGLPYLVSKAKAIYKPNVTVNPTGVALSVRHNATGPYEDVVTSSDEPGRWTMRYQMEGDDPTYYTNAALRQNLCLGIPVAVLIQVEPKPNPRYLVRGLAKVCSEGIRYFDLTGMSSTDGH